MMKHTKRTREFPHQTEQEENDSPLSEDSISGSEDEGLARHVWDSYTNSQSQLNLIKENENAKGDVKGPVCATPGTCPGV